MLVFNMFNNNMESDSIQVSLSFLEKMLDNCNELLTKNDWQRNSSDPADRQRYLRLAFDISELEKLVQPFYPPVRRR